MAEYVACLGDKIMVGKPEAKSLLGDVGLH